MQIRLSWIISFRSCQRNELFSLLLPTAHIYETNFKLKYV